LEIDVAALKMPRKKVGEFLNVNFQRENVHKGIGFSLVSLSGRCSSGVCQFAAIRAHVLSLNNMVWRK
jgi:hypothetical protein